ncbi:MAG: hypothetical protein HC923_01945 [Myxococcales bacterium]|nr:hypothetical protein [Myxococcales bacterium]
MTENGFVALLRGEVTEKIKVDESRRAARSALRRFDADFLKAFLRTTIDRRVAYFTVGHGERGFEHRPEDDARSAVTFLAQQLRALQYDVKPLGLAEGLDQSVPEDADLVFIVGPTQEFLPSEQRSLRRALEGGGRILMALDAASDARFEELFAPAKVTFDPTPLADDQTFLQITRSRADRTALPTNLYARHPSVDDLEAAESVATVFIRTGTFSATEGSSGSGLTRR